MSKQLFDIAAISGAKLPHVTDPRYVRVAEIGFLDLVVAYC